MDIGVKICGLTTKEAVKVSVLNRAAMLGFHFATDSNYCITPEYAAYICRDIPQFMNKIAVIDHFDKGVFEEIANALNPQYVQCKQSVDVDKIRKHYNVKMICDLTDAQYVNHVDKYDYYLINFSELGSYVDIPKAKIIISGSISRHNVKNIIGQTGVKLISVTDSLGISPGILDPKLINDFFVSLKHMAYF